MTLTRGIRRLALLLTLALPLACVNPFTPANPEPPAPGGVPEIFSTPDDVLDTMRNAIESKSSGGADAWLHAYAESTQTGDRAFRSFYDGAVKQIWEGGSRTAPEPWNVALERVLPSRLFGIRANDRYAFTWEHDRFSESDTDPGAADTAWFHRQYTLSATSTTNSNPDTIATGFCDLSFQKTNGRWSIYRWHDRVDPSVGVNPSNDARTMSWWRLESLAR